MINQNDKKNVWSNSEMLAAIPPWRLMESSKQFTALCKALTPLSVLVFLPAVPGGGIGGGGKPGGGPGNGGGGGSPGGGIPGGIAAEGGRIPAGGWPSGCCGGGWYDIAWKLITIVANLCQRKVCRRSNMAALVCENQVQAGKPRFQYLSRKIDTSGGWWCERALNLSQGP